MNIQDIRIAVFIPTRGDREVFLNNCLRMLAAQTLKLNPYILVIDFKALNNEKDITKRYRFGYNNLTSQSFDLIAFIEDDDYYAPTYIETMATEWLKAGQPDIMGTGKTIYYHLKLHKYFVMNHPSRSSAMNTFIKPDLNLTWPADNYAFTDLHLWNTSDIAQSKFPVGNQLPKNMWLKGHIFNPDKIISIGMKHGVGLCGGRNHIDRLERFTTPDFDMKFLRDNCDMESFEFYSKFFK